MSGAPAPLPSAHAHAHAPFPSHHASTSPFAIVTASGLLSSNPSSAGGLTGSEGVLEGLAEGVQGSLTFPGWIMARQRAAERAAQLREEAYQLTLTTQAQAIQSLLALCARLLKYANEGVTHTGNERHVALGDDNLSNHFSSQTPRVHVANRVASTGSARECLSLVWAQVHARFISLPAVSELVHTQGYAPELLPEICAGVPSMHVLLFFVPTLLGRPGLAQQVFSVQLLSRLSCHYPMPLSLEHCSRTVRGLGSEDKWDFPRAWGATLERERGGDKKTLTDEPALPLAPLVLRVLGPLKLMVCTFPTLGREVLDLLQRVRGQAEATSGGGMTHFMTPEVERGARFESTQEGVVQFGSEERCFSGQEGTRADVDAVAYAIAQRLAPDY